MKAWPAAVVAAVVTTLTAGTQASAEKPHIVVAHGVTQPVFGYGDAVRERVFVDSPYDSDVDGILDVIAVDIMRPAASEHGLKVPVIMDPSPYYSTLGRGNESELKADADGDGLLDRWPLFYDNYFVPRGYAVVLMDMIGTDNSTGCPTVHEASDNLSPKVVIGSTDERSHTTRPALPWWPTGTTGGPASSASPTTARSPTAPRCPEWTV